jgi:uncharacterized protein with FMN-binding domain
MGDRIARIGIVAPRNRNTLNTNLVALGTAAVLAVYAAGYTRTRTAAQALAAESVRRPPPPSPVEPVTPAVDTAVAATLPRVDSTAPKKAPKPVEVAKAELPPLQPKDSVVAAVPVPTVVDSTTTSAAADSTKKPAPKWKDGLYFGYGRSRHGDIEAAVEIKEGRIASAFISECLTQYSCSWIAHLPPQVVARQSAEVDYVSGATHSANALYYALVNALTKAK